MSPCAINPQIKVGMPGLGKRLREARRNAGLSQEALAEHLGVSWMSVHRWEHDIRPIRYYQLVAVSRRCDADIGVLVPGLQAEPAEPPAASTDPPAAS